MKADIGIIGGSGLYSMATSLEDIEVNTEYGKPSDKLSIGKLGGRTVAFLPRHGAKHILPPHKVPYKANIATLKSLGVSRVIATSAVGSLAPDYKPGDIVFFDQFVNATYGRDDTFFNSYPVAHVSAAEPYCPELRQLAAKAADKLKIKYHESGTVVVINGPRFSTKAESRLFSKQGIHTINMTQYPEVILAREQEVCYLGIGIVTDYDAGLEGRNDIEPVSMLEINRMFAANVDKVKALITEIVSSIPQKRYGCKCSSAMANAMIK